ncbi:MAG: L-threonylcarbamoyladenylate synthase [Fibrobacterota bacterium]
MTHKTCKADDPACVQHAAEILRKGGVIIHPTETLYGFAANALIPSALRRVDAIKRRRAQDTYLVLLKDRAMAEDLQLTFERLADKLAARFWPGPLTLLLPVERTSPLNPLAVQGLVAVRVSPDPFVSALFGHIDFPVISTSVNTSGTSPLLDPVKIAAQFQGSVEMIFERGTYRSSVPSTLVSCVNNTLTLVRKGAISEEDLYGL